jgi:Tfp pilus assembly protein PilO
MNGASHRSTLLKVDAVGLLVVLILGAAASLFVIEPALTARREERAKREALGPQEALRDQNAMQLKLVLERLRAARAELDAVPLRLVAVGQINHRLVKITEMAADTGLGLDQFSPGAQRPTADAVVVPLRLMGRGNFPSALLFLSRLHADFADMAVTGFRLSGNTSDQSAAGTFVFDLAWYAAPESGAGDRQAEVPLP